VRQIPQRGLEALDHSQRIVHEGEVSLGIRWLVELAPIVAKSGGQDEFFSVADNRRTDLKACDLPQSGYGLLPRKPRSTRAQLGEQGGAGKVAGLKAPIHSSLCDRDLERTALHGLHSPCLRFCTEQVRFGRPHTCFGLRQRVAQEMTMIVMMSELRPQLALLFLQGGQLAGGIEEGELIGTAAAAATARLSNGRKTGQHAPRVTLGRDLRSRPRPQLHRARFPRTLPTTRRYRDRAR
jgi:hypothetical protein